MSTPEKLHAAHEFEKRVLESDEANVEAAAAKIAKAQDQLAAANSAYEQATKQRDEQIVRLEDARKAVEGLSVTAAAGVANIGVEGN
jgi:predicted metal-dependent phosphoesterase TrpH